MAFGQTDLEHKTGLDGAFTNSEKVELVEFGTQCIFPLTPLFFWVCTRTPGKAHLLGKD